jgi:hypothetical protein
MKKLLIINICIPAIFQLSVAITGCANQKSAGRLSAGTGLTGIFHIVHMGQSLGGGEQSFPLVTDYNTGFGNLKFSMGTNTWANNYYPDRPGLRAAENFRWVPLTAQKRGGEGETIANGLCDHLSQSVQNVNSKNLHFLFSYAGEGGRYLRELDKRHDDAKDPRAGKRRSPGGHYNTSIDDVKRAKKMADSLHLPYNVFAITWMQGERGNDQRVNRWDTISSRKAFLEIYKNDLVQIKNDYQHDIMAITAQKKKPAFFTYQTGGAMSGTAQLMACDQEKDMYMVASTYMLPTALNGYYYNNDKLIHGAAVHLSADGERWLGEMFGKVIRRVNIEGEKWQPLRPEKSWYEKGEQSVFIRFHVPNPPLVIDSVFLPEQGTGSGLEVYDESNHVCEIKEVSIIGKDVLKIMLTHPLPEKKSCFVKYGLNNYVKKIATPIKTIHTGLHGADGHLSVQVVFEGNIQNEFSILKQEGVFSLANITGNDKDATSMVVRHVYQDKNGSTVLEGEAESLKNNIPFQTGQYCFTARIFPYGNLHDSDKEKSTFTFRDQTYGHRHGQPYPLFNWCIIFRDLAIAR